jgi:hypothetical protein
MLPTYQRIYDKIRHLTQGRIANEAATQPLQQTFDNVEAAKQAYLQRYDDALEETLQRVPSFLLSTIGVYAPTLLIPILASPLGDCFLTEQDKQQFVFMARFRAMQAQANAAIMQELQSSSSILDVDPAAFEKRLYHKEMAYLAIAGVHHQVHNCMSISTLVVFELLAAGIPGEQIEQFNKRKTSVAPDDDAHAFVVVNRKKDSDKNNMATWGEDCYIIDPWYGYLGRAIDLNNNPNRFSHYPLIMSLEDKRSFTCNYSQQALLSYCRTLNTMLEKNQAIPVPGLEKKMK